MLVDVNIIDDIDVIDDYIDANANNEDYSSNLDDVLPNDVNSEEGD